MKLFFVGGPNQRKDFHIERGEEVMWIKLILRFCNYMNALHLLLLCDCF